MNFFLSFGCRCLFFFVPGAFVINELSSRFRRGRPCMCGPRSVWRFSLVSLPAGLLGYTVFIFPGCFGQRFDERVR